MSVLTKVFVVLLTVFSIALSMLVVSAFAKQEDWREMAKANEAARQATIAEATTLKANQAIDQERWQKRHQDDLATINELKDARATDAAKLAAAERNEKEAKNAREISQGSLDSALAQNGLLATGLNREREISNKLTTENSELRRRNVDLNDRVKELTVNIAMATSQVRALQQQITAMEGSGGQTVAQAPGGPNVVEANIPSAAVPATPAVTAPIRGEVTSVKGNLASISVGNTDGVAPNMTFLVYRKPADGGTPQYLGSIRVTRVETNEAAGLIEQSTGDIKPGDLVRDELSLAKRG